MHYRIRLTVFLFLFTVSAFAQSSYDLLTGPLLPSKKDVFVSYFGISNGYIYKIGNENKKLEYQRLGSSLSPEATAPVMSADDDKNKRLHAFTVMLNGEICKFTFSKDKKAMGFRLYGQKVNSQTLQPEGEVKEVAFAQVESELVLNNVIDPAYWLFPHHVSQDRSTLILLTYLKNGDKTTGAQVQAFDSNFNELWKKDGPIGYVMLGGLMVTDNNSAVAVWRSMQPEPGKSPLTYQRFSKDNATASFDLALSGGNAVQNMVVQMTKEKDLVACGFYSKKDENNTKGLYVLHLDPQSLKITSEKLLPVDVPKETEGTMTYNVISNLSVAENGDLLLATEQVSLSNYLVTSGYNPGQPRTPDYTNSIYNYGNITVYRLTKDGTIAWKSSVPLNQKAYNDNADYAGFLCLIKSDKVYILFSDSEKNATVTKDGTPEEFNTKKPGKIYLATMDASSGNFTREVIASGSSELALNVKQSIQLDENNLLLYTDGKKSYQLEKISFH